MNTSGMSETDELWIPLVDEPIGWIVAQIAGRHPEIDALVDSPQRMLAFRTFAYIRVGLLLGQLLVEQRHPGPTTAKRDLDRAAAARPGTPDAVAAEVRRSPRRSPPTRGTRDDEPIGPDDDARERFREFARSSSARTAS